MKRVTKLTAILFGALLGAQAASAAPMTWLGATGSLMNETVNTPWRAKTKFLRHATNRVGVETFEALKPRDRNFTLSFNEGLSATIKGGDVEVDGTPGEGRRAVGGKNFAETEGVGGFTMTFNKAFTSFGFFAMDVGDFGNRLWLGFQDIKGKWLWKPVVVNRDLRTGVDNGMLLFFGLHDNGNSYRKVEFRFAPGVQDRFGIDNVFATAAKAPPPPPPPSVPLPATLGFLLAGLGAFAGLRRMRG